MLYALLALMAPLWDRTAAQGKAPHGGATHDDTTHDEATDRSVSRLLIVAAAALAAVLAILLADLHRDELRALGLAGDAAPVAAMFLGP